MPNITRIVLSTLFLFFCIPFVFAGYNPFQPDLIKGMKYQVAAKVMQKIVEFEEIDMYLLLKV